MKAVIHSSRLSGTITAPVSKSGMQRACAAALIKGGTTVLHNPGHSADDQAALDIIQKLGAKVQKGNEELVITSNGIHPQTSEINAGESGLSVRMFTPIAAISEQRILIEGTGSLRKRPLSFFNEVLPALDVKVDTNKGLLPMSVQGPLQPKNITVDGSLSSQFLTGLLFAYAASGAMDVAIRVVDLNSKPYVDLTLSVMAAFGLKTPVNLDYKEFYFPVKSGAEFPNETINYTVEGDWSGGAFLLVAGAIAGNIHVKGLDVFSTQADKAIWPVLQSSGATVSVKDDLFHIAPFDRGQAFQFDATDCPDLFPPLVALAAFCDGVSQISGVQRLVHKESNRAVALQQEFGKLGVNIHIKDNIMLVEGIKTIKSATVDSHHDHRIAMACAVAALRADGPVTIENAEAVNKSYPDFWDDLRQLNGNVSLTL